MTTANAAENALVPANLEVEGRIIPSHAIDLVEFHSTGAELTLRLADGRSLDFSVVDEPRPARPWKTSRSTRTTLRASLAYHRLDLWTERDFVVRRLKSSIRATVFNVYNQRNFWFYDYDVAAEMLTTEVALMRRAANVFVRIGM